MQFRFYFHCVCFHHSAGCLEIALALDALDFVQQLSEEFTELFVVIHLHVSLSVLFHEFGHLVGSTLLECPFGYQLTVTHMGFFYIVTQLDTYQLSHQSVHHVRIIFSLISIVVRSQSQFTHLGIRQIIQAEEVGTGFFDGRAVCLQGIGVNSWKQLTRAMTQTFMQVGMEVAGQVAILFKVCLFHFAINELVRESVAMGSLVISISEVSDGYRLRAMYATNPVGVRKIDADGCSRIKVARNDGTCNHLGRHALHFFFLEALVHR